MSEPTKCPKCGAPMREIHDPSGFVVFRHEVGGRPCLENQLAQALEREATEKARAEKAEDERDEARRLVLEADDFQCSIASALGWPSDGKPFDKAVRELRAEAKRLREVLQLILPMAKGYAAAHPVGGNKEYIRDAEVALAAGEPDAPSKEGG